MVGNVKGVKTRGANVLGIAFEGNETIEKIVDSAVKKGCDVDKPRDLAKSVTVE